MQSRTGLESPTLSRADLRLLGIGLQDLYAGLLEQPLPPRIREALARTDEEPHRLPEPMAWRHVSAAGVASASRQTVMAL